MRVGLEGPSNLSCVRGVKESVLLNLCTSYSGAKGKTFWKFYFSIRRLTHKILILFPLHFVSISFNDVIVLNEGCHNHRHVPAVTPPTITTNEPFYTQLCLRCVWMYPKWPTRFVPRYKLINTDFYLFPARFLAISFYLFGYGATIFLQTVGFLVTSARFSRKNINWTGPNWSPQKRYSPMTQSSETLCKFSNVKTRFLL